MWVVNLEPLPMHERHAHGLQRLAEMCGKLVEQAYHRAIIAEEPEAKDRASLVFDRLARGFRLTLSLEARFARDLRREDREIAESAPSRLPRPIAAPRPDRAAPGPTEADHESEMDVEETSDALAVRLKHLSYILDDQAEMLDPDGTHRAALDELAQWWAAGQRYERGFEAPEPPLRRAKRRPSRPPRPKDFQSRDVPSRDVYPEDILDADIDDDDDDEPLWLESG